MGLKPDVVFVATGAERLSLPIPGIDRENVHHVLDVDTGRAAVGERVVVCGGGLSGTESALQLAMDGKKVTVVDMLPVEQFAKDHSPAPRGMSCSCWKSTALSSSAASASAASTMTVSR